MKNSSFKEATKKAVVLALLFSEIQTFLQLSYWSRVIAVGRHLVFWNGQLYWTTGGKGRFLPWPQYPGMAMVMTTADNTDKFFIILSPLTFISK